MYSRSALRESNIIATLFISRYLRYTRLAPSCSPEAVDKLVSQLVARMEQR